MFFERERRTDNDADAVASDAVHQAQRVVVLRLRPHTAFFNSLYLFWRAPDSDDQWYTSGLSTKKFCSPTLEASQGQISGQSPEKLSPGGSI